MIEGLRARVDEQATFRRNARWAKFVLSFFVILRHDGGAHGRKGQPVMSSVETLVVDLLEWIGPGPRPYREVQEAWRTSCPKLPVWEDAVEGGYLESWLDHDRGRLVAVSPRGVTLLERWGRANQLGERS